MNPTSAARSAGGLIHGAKRATQAILVLIGAGVIGFGVPAAWLHIAGAIQSASHSEGAAFTAILVALAGIPASYVALIVLTGLVADRRLRRTGQAAPVRRYNWNRSLRDERHSAPKLNWLESLFVVTAIMVGTAYMVWFFFFAGSSLPGG